MRAWEDSKEEKHQWLKRHSLDRHKRHEQQPNKTRDPNLKLSLLYHNHNSHSTKPMNRAGNGARHGLSMCEWKCGVQRTTRGQQQRVLFLGLMVMNEWNGMDDAESRKSGLSNNHHRVLQSLMRGRVCPALFGIRCNNVEWSGKERIGDKVKKACSLLCCVLWEHVPFSTKLKKWKVQGDRQLKSMVGRSYRKR